ncbi:MAG: hypothetical protein P9M03_04130 [Candidatus Theseobacter exili]|nr:hypothetical protein [Candidatus Theseobacter exili]
MKESVNRMAALMKYLPLLLLVVVSMFFGILYPRFFSIQNVLNLIRQMSFLMIVSMGMTFIILMGSIDASVGANATFCGVIGALLAPYLGAGAIVVGLLAGAGVGALNGILVTKVKVPSFLVTLALMGALDGAALLLMHSSPVNISNQTFLNFSNGSLLFLSECGFNSNNSDSCLLLHN